MPVVSERIEMLLARKRPWILPYLTAGYPDAAETVDLLLALEEGGADAVELGLPFSDPLADGPVVQAASQAALARGMTHAKALDLVAEFRAQSSLPLLLMGYLNPMLAYGAERFFREAAAAGADGLIVPDLPPEEAEPFHAPARAAGLEWVFLAAPTSSDERLIRIDHLSTSFGYCVSLAGVTGAREQLPEALETYLARAAKLMTKPFVVGFGISTAAHVRRVAPPAAGAVVGSALLRTLGEARSGKDRRTRAAGLVRELRG
jgi:tryptophan synthase alpha chain